MEKIILRPTDYNDGKSNPYSFEDLKNDVIGLNDLSSKELKTECQARWNEFSKFPIPSNYRKYKAVADLAQAKNIDVSFDKAKKDRKSNSMDNFGDNQPGM